MIAYIKNIFQDKSMAYNFYAASFLVLLFILPFHRVAASIPTILLVISFAILLVSNKGVSLINHLSTYNRYLILLVLFLVFHLIHILLIVPEGSWHVIQLGMLLVLYPLLLLYTDKQLLMRLIESFLIGCVLFAFTAMTIAATKFAQLGPNVFFYTDLLKPFKQNPIFVSQFFNLALVLLGFHYLKNDGRKYLYKYLFVALVLMIFVVLCGSKIGYLVLPVALISFIFSIVKRQVVKLSIILSLGLVAFILYQFVPYINHEVNGTIWQWTKHDKIVMAHQLPRTVVWPLATELAKENILVGAGLGKAVEELSKQYAEIDYQKGIEHGYNAHNQFLESFIETGIFGLMILLILLLYSMGVAVYYRSYPYLILLVVIVAYMMVESTFKTQASILAFAVLNPILMLFTLFENEEKYD